MAIDTKDTNPTETKEWIESLESLLETEGVERAHYIIERLIDKARRSGAYLPYTANTAYLNTIPVGKQKRSPGDLEIEWRIRAMVRWNAMAMVVGANRSNEGLGGHIASFASAASLYDVGFNHFFKGPDSPQGKDLVYTQGHSSPGMYARAFLEGRLSEDQMSKFRREVDEGGLSSYPHPSLMPNFWSFPTVSMGLGPLMAIYNARFMRYLNDRGIVNTSDRKVWAFMGDGESDEPESLGAISLAGREKLDNLIFVVNCNLQRLDGPVRGNGKIIQELEGVFLGAGWNVIKVIWGSYWDPLLARDKDGLLRKRMEEVVDGEYQAYKASGDGAFVREHFFGKSPELKELVADLSDDDVWRLNRGGHDPHKIYAAYAEAVAHKGQPTVILAKTVKGYGMGESGEGQNITHQQKKMGEKSLREFRDRLRIPISDEDLEKTPFYRPPEDSKEIQYLLERRKALGGSLPIRKVETTPLKIPDLTAFENVVKSPGNREFSTTMAFVRVLTALLRNKDLKNRIVPIVPDEARTFGMEGMFRQLGIYSSVGQLYEPMDAGQIAPYKEARNGQILEEGITEAGSLSSWIAAGTSYSNNGHHMIPFYVFYSMFGFQRVGDLIWAAADARTRGFLIGGTSGRTTLNGEGLQHQDGQSHILASVVPSCVSYDPTYAYELAVIIQDGMRRMYDVQEDVFYYITTLNENYKHPPMPKGVEDGIRRGLYRLSPTGQATDANVALLGSGAILREVQAAAEILKDEWKILSSVWSATSFNELRKDGLEADRWNRLHPQNVQKIPYVTQCLKNHDGPVIAATDYVKAYADGIRQFVPGRYVSLGTDGFGRSDTRDRLREFFEVNRHHIVVAALKALADDGKIDVSQVVDAIKRYGIDTRRPNPATL